MVSLSLHMLPTPGQCNHFLGAVVRIVTLQVAVFAFIGSLLKKRRKSSCVCPSDSAVTHAEFQNARFLKVVLEVAGPNCLDDIHDTLEDGGSIKHTVDIMSRFCRCHGFNQRAIRAGHLFDQVIGHGGGTLSVTPILCQENYRIK